MIDLGIYLTRVDVGRDWPEYVYLTRDADDGTGALLPVVEIWATRPVTSPEPDGGRGCMWLDGELLGRYSLEAARQRFNVWPETASECVRVPCR